MGISTSVSRGGELVCCDGVGGGGGPFFLGQFVFCASDLLCWVVGFSRLTYFLPPRGLELYAPLVTGISL